MITIKNSSLDVERIFCISADSEEEAEIMARTTIAVDEYLYEVLDLGISE